MAGAPCGLVCNECAKPMPALSQAVAASCNHLFCTSCTQRKVEADEGCPLCNGVITRGNIKLVTVLQPSEKMQLVLCGQTPEVIADTALAAINFYVEQQRLSGMYENQQLSRKLHSMQNQCRKKLSQLQGQYQQKLARMAQEKAALEDSMKELQQKYAEKSSSTRKLNEMLTDLQRRHEELKRHCTTRPGGVGAAGRSGVAARPHGGGAPSGRTTPLFSGGGAQMMTTVQQRTATFDMSPGDSSGFNLLGPGSALVAAGNNMFGGAGQRRSTTGGMFAAGALGNNRGGNGAGSAGGGHRMRAIGNGSFLGSPGSFF